MTNPRVARLPGILATVGAVGLLGLGAPAQVGAAPEVTWSYSGETGPANWGGLSPAFARCADGTAQSPINVASTTEAKLRNLVFSYRPGDAEVFNNGHTVEAEPAPGRNNTVTIGTVIYTFAQFHFHSPSEHTFRGRRYPLEIHFVHRSPGGAIAVIAVFATEGRRNPEWAKFVNVIPVATVDPAQTTIDDLDWDRLLPTDQRTIRYNGSLTTPPCTEGVKWTLLTVPVEMSRPQIDAFKAAYTGNVRPVQRLNGRVPLVDIRANGHVYAVAFDPSPATSLTLHGSPTAHPSALR